MVLSTAHMRGDQRGSDSTAGTAADQTTAEPCLARDRRPFFLRRGGRVDLPRRDRASFVRDRRDAAGDLDAGYRRIVRICPLPSNEGDVFFSLSLMCAPSHLARVVDLADFSSRATSHHGAVLSPRPCRGSLYGALAGRSARFCPQGQQLTTEELRLARDRQAAPFLHCAGVDLADFSIFYYCASKS